MIDKAVVTAWNDKVERLQAQLATQTRQTQKAVDRVEELLSWLESADNRIEKAEAESARLRAALERVLAADISDEEIRSALDSEGEG